MESVRGGESGRLDINFVSSPTFEVSDSSAVRRPSLGEEGMDGEGEAVFGSPGVPVRLDLVEAVSEPPLLGKERDGSLLKHFYDINDS